MKKEKIWDEGPDSFEKTLKALTRDELKIRGDALRAEEERQYRISQSLRSRASWYRGTKVGRPRKCAST